MEIFPQVLINVDVARKPPLEEMPKVRAEVERVEAELGDRGRVLVRYSGTQNMCRVMVEGPTDDQTRAFCEQIAAVVKEEIG